MSLKFSVQTTEVGTNFAASEERLRTMSRLKMWLVRRRGTSIRRGRGDELPTVPNQAVRCGLVRRLRLVVWFSLQSSKVGLALIAMSVFDLIRLSAPRVEAFDGLIGRHARDGIFRWSRDASTPGRGKSRRACGGGIGCGVAIKDGVAARPVERGEHMDRARNWCRRCNGELEVADCLTSRADGYDLGVGVGSLLEVTQFTPVARISPLRTMTAPTGRRRRSDVLSASDGRCMKRIAFDG